MNSSSRTPARTLLLDLDGSLTDPGVGITRCIHHALVALGRTPPTVESLTWCIGPPLQTSFAQLLDTDDALEVARAVELYRERFRAVGLLENEPIPGIHEALAQLRAHGHRLVLATSKPRLFATRIARHFGFDAQLEAIFGAELDGRRSDKAELIGHVLRAVGLEASGAVMVGDRSHDIVGARANGLDSIGVLWGYGDAAELTTAGATWLAHEPADLARLVHG